MRRCRCIYPLPTHSTTCGVRRASRWLAKALPTSMSADKWLDVLLMQATIEEPVLCVDGRNVQVMEMSEAVRQLKAGDMLPSEVWGAL